MAGLVEARVSVEDFLGNRDVGRELSRVSTGLLEPEKVLRFALNAVNTTPRLRECSLKSWMGCLMAATGLGLEPNTPLEHAWLVPYKNRRKIDGTWQDVYEAQFLIGYKGLVNLSWRNERQLIMLPGVACENDTYSSKLTSAAGTGVLWEFEAARRNRGEPVTAFCFTRYITPHGHHGDALTELDKEEVYQLRSRSMTYRTLTANVANARNDRERVKAEQKLAETPWVFWEAMMWTKSAIRRHASYLPLSPALTVAARIDGLQDEARFDFEAMADTDVARAVMAGEMDPPTIEATASEPAGPEETEDPAPPAEDPPPAEDKPKPSNGRRRGTAKPPAAAAQEAAPPAQQQEEPPPAEDPDPEPAQQQEADERDPPPLEGVDTSILFGE